MCDEERTQVPPIPDELIEELRREMEDPTDPSIPDLPEISIQDMEPGDKLVILKGEVSEGRE